ncbi:MAG: CCA tRNA nucleotidyltransferase [Chloroflexi bacterium]|nr:CCA tRNA nucleotidyltransferase [Chloroflexota bacterium]
MQTINLTAEIARQLPPQLVNFMRLAGELAERRGVKLYLVGGVVRDLLLSKANFDLDLVVEGDAIALAQEIAPHLKAKITTHSRFNTAKLRWDHWTADLAAARSETYAHPGALPTVKPSSLKNDLIRRDFTINAMAIDLSPGSYGELIDLYGGKSDLAQKLVRILHEKSFMDDATRILRGIRYEQRLDFGFEEKTLALLKRDITMLETITTDRIHHEIELFLKEVQPEKIFRRAEDLGVLPQIHPALRGDKWLADKFEIARKLSAPEPPSPNLYFALLVYQMKDQQIADLIDRLRLSKLTARTLQDTFAIKDKIKALSDARLRRSQVYNLLEGYSLTAITANSIATNFLIAHRHLQLFMDELRFVKPALKGDELIKLGVPAGPKLREVLQGLLDARLDGEVENRQEEISQVKRWLEEE